MLSTYSIPSKLPGEEVVKIMRRDLFVLFKRVVFFAFLIAMLGGVATLIYTFNPEIVLETYFPIVTLAGIFVALFIWLFFFFSFIDYYLDTWVITNERIINIEQNGFFSRTISEQRLFRIQDVTSEVKGVAATIFKYGNVMIQTAGENQRFNFEEVPDPNGVRDTLIKLAEQDRVRMGKEFAAESIQGVK